MMLLIKRVEQTNVANFSDTYFDLKYALVNIFGCLYWNSKALKPDTRNLLVPKDPLENPNIEIPY